LRKRGKKKKNRSSERRVKEGGGGHDDSRVSKRGSQWSKGEYKFADERGREGTIRGGGEGDFEKTFLTGDMSTPRVAKHERGGRAGEGGAS